MLRFLFFIAILISIESISAKTTNFKIAPLGQLIKVEANQEHGFNFPFFLYIPVTNTKKQNLLIVPNNTGSSITDLEEQNSITQRQALVEASLAVKTSSVLLIPGFPRPNIEPPIYTHSLSRSTLLVKDGPLKRIDLQLIKMSEAARILLKKKYKISLRQKFFLSGFSASAMFVNRFAFIHPTLVAGVAVGAPGGWPLAPLKKFKNKLLPYPVGISDLDEITNENIDLPNLKQVPFFFYIGDKDENDSVIFRDSYTKENEDLVFSTFGKKPVERWSIAEKLYQDAGLNAKFKLYKDLGHETGANTRTDVIEFFNATKVE
ncbi:hypothetical protein SHI21_15110 [Bacteriovorax sp. PP10]|uniref:Uncharacterized protein n=1 Tax=Bacteriovorax antarcticus TaxID=3088717 RepID=A0ABU5VX39_9BACT|nr:hypothetical protein [Bacteriovorax sp. PP10]MEA9357556.1 hypothetical protein [Bacteriovorax sp. PP10]